MPERASILPLTAPRERGGSSRELPRGHPTRGPIGSSVIFAAALAVALDLPSGLARAAGASSAAPLPIALGSGAIADLRARIAADLPAIVDRWVAIAEIPAPSGREELRAARIEKTFRELGLEEVRRDDIGNVMGVMRGRSPGGPRVVYAAHLDTVAREGDPARVTRLDPEHLQGPGVKDDASGLIGLIEAARVLRKMDLLPPDDLWLVATAQEEIGLLGARKFLDDNSRMVARFVAIDGELGSVSYGATAIVWLKIHFLAPGGHTLKSASLPSTTLAAARAIDAIYGLDVPDHPESRASWLNIGSLGGGDVVNAMARDAWFTVDLRSNSPKIQARLAAKVRAAAAQAARRTGVELRVEELLSMPGASLPGRGDSAFVRLAADSLSAAGWGDPTLVMLGTADHNRALERGIPGICIGVTSGSGMHTPQEIAQIPPLPTGIAALAILMASLPAKP